MVALPGCVCASLRQVTRLVTQLYDDALRPSGLRAMQFQILMTFKHKGEATISELVPLLGLDQTTLTRSLALLERQHWIERIPKPDRRLRTYRLAEAGERALLVAMPHWAALQSRVLEHIGDAAWQRARKPLAALLELDSRRQAGK